MAHGSEGRTRADDLDVDDLDIDAILPDLTEFEPDLTEFLDLSGPPPEPLVLDRPASPPPPAPPPASAPSHRTADERPARPDRTDRADRSQPPAVEPTKTAWAPPKVERSIYPDPSFPAREVAPPPRDELDVPEFLGHEPEAETAELDHGRPDDPAPGGPTETPVEAEAAPEPTPQLAVEEDTGEHDVLAEFDQSFDEAVGDELFGESARTEPPSLTAPSGTAVPPGRLFPEPTPDPTADVFAEEATGFIDRIVESRQTPEVETAPAGEIPAVADDPEIEIEIEATEAEPMVEPEAAASPDEPPQSRSAPPAPTFDDFATQLGAEWGASEPAGADVPEVRQAGLREAEVPEAAEVLETDPDPVEALIEPDDDPSLLESGQAHDPLTPEAPTAGGFAIRAEPEPEPEPEPATGERASATGEPESADTDREVADDAAPELEPAPAFASMAPTAAAGYLTPDPDEPLGNAPCTESSPVADIADLIPMWRRHLTKVLTVGVAAAAVVALLLTNPRSGGDSSEVTSAPENVAAEGAEVDPDVSLVAEAAIPLVDVYDSPDDVAPRMSLEHPTEVGGPLVFLVKEQRGEWLQVFLPVRPNGSTGWVKANQVRLSKHDYKVVVHLSAHRLELTKDGATTFEAPVAIGTRDTPTPGGTFYIKELLKPPDPDTLYGNFAFGLSGFSNVLDSFNGGEGVIGIHGTNDPSVIGGDVSRGCIRLTNEDMLELVGTLPLGTPVEILP